MERRARSGRGDTSHVPDRDLQHFFYSINHFLQRDLFRDTFDALTRNYDESDKISISLKYRMMNKF